MPFMMDDDDMYISMPLVIGIYIAIIAFCLLGNLAVIVIVVARPVLHTSTSYFLISLSVADLFVGGVVVSLTLAHKLNLHYASGFGRLACVVPPYLELTCITASVYSLLCVSIDRYRAIVLARKPARDGLIILSFAMVWVGSLLYAAKVFLQDYLTVNSGDPISASDTTPAFQTAETASGSASNTTSPYVKAETTSGGPEDLYSLDTSFCSLLVEEDTADLPFRSLVTFRPLSNS
ncbi:alpha-1A adrenergic receptor-like [Biomphalaria glabrata]|uniref:Alpha-1A adrenergic receptor-like n=1 Tax=Biomphalaria glabrata TaxID=6526 RepID=A0A9W3BIE0_BIOGL|nr:alpha-1A adrenergic receptor-like [Biomphalaria glabrata]